ncbi:hypothetical protein HYW54_05085 [Candidatus Gottesmanbacteria bacterium]|nr:hypothetical protein [Candidatus Gottesmanbacteria bacterium]
MHKRHNFGKIFGEMVEKGFGRSRKTKEILAPGSRLVFFMTILVVLMGILATRIFELTIIRGSYYRYLAEGQRVKEIRIAAPRGIIYDRNNTPLVRNIPVRIESKEGIMREYPFAEFLAHVIGYTGEIDEKEMEKRNRIETFNNRFFPGDIVGKMGIEKSYDGRLRGRGGRRLTEVDAKGEHVRDLGESAPLSGENIHLSLDLGLQKVATSSFENKMGAVVALEPASGEILALYSSPSFDPNVFIEGVNVDDILDSADMPLFNRAIGGVYPPGSTFKIVTAISALEEEKIKADTIIEDTGVIEIGPFKFSNWYFTQYGRKDGLVDIVKAIQRSNDIFFYKTGEFLGITKLAAYAHKLGVGRSLRIDIEGEAEGVMPDPDWRMKARGDEWYLGDTYHVAIGQGDLLTTPLQVNNWTNIVANGGRLCRPHLIKDQKENCQDLGIKKENIELVREGMIKACQPGGTGWPLFNFKYQISNIKYPIDEKNFLSTLESTTSAKKLTEIVTACKTGTAEFGSPENKTHAWFTIFAPAYDPEISITVLVEEGGEGSSVAAPIAKKMLEEWFSRN